MSPKNVDYYENEKILVRQILGKTIIATFDDNFYYADQTLYIIKNYEGRNGISLKYILALINSNLYGFYFKKNYSEDDDLFPKIKVNELKDLPIKQLSPESQPPFITLVDKILAGKKLVASKNLSGLDLEDLEQSIKNWETEIDTMVYALYELTPAEIAVVEGR